MLMTVMTADLLLYLASLTDLMTTGLCRTHSIGTSSGHSCAPTITRNAKKNLQRHWKRKLLQRNHARRDLPLPCNILELCCNHKACTNSSAIADAARSRYLLSTSSAYRHMWRNYADTHELPTVSKN